MDRIKLKRVYEGVSEDDGYRVLVERLWPRGLKKEQVAMDLWLKEVAPSPELRTWFGHDPAKYGRSLNAAIGPSWRKSLSQSTS